METLPEGGTNIITFSSRVPMNINPNIARGKKLHVLQTWMFSLRRYTRHIIPTLCFQNFIQTFN